MLIEDLLRLLPAHAQDFRKAILRNMPLSVVFERRLQEQISANCLRRLAEVLGSCVRDFD
jgi:hypothetical protein